LSEGGGSAEAREQGIEEGGSPVQTDDAQAACWQAARGVKQTKRERIHLAPPGSNNNHTRNHKTPTTTSGFCKEKSWFLPTLLSTSRYVVDEALPTVHGACCGGKFSPELPEPLQQAGDKIFALRHDMPTWMCLVPANPNQTNI
jgi:hypothetical protein